MRQLSHLHPHNRDLADRNRASAPAPAPPHTPQRPKCGSALNAWILDLEKRWRLGLRSRDILWSPSKNTGDLADKVYGQIQQLFWKDRPSLDIVLKEFNEVASSCPVQERLGRLHRLLGSKTKSPLPKRGTSFDGLPKPAEPSPLSRSSNLTAVFHGSTTGQNDSNVHQVTFWDSESSMEEDQEFYTPPSPSKSASRRYRRPEMSPCSVSPSRKRSSESSTHDTSPMTWKTSTDKCLTQRPPAFKKLALTVPPSLPLYMTTANSSANTSFDASGSSQRTLVDSAATSFTDDGANHEKHTKSSSISFNSLINNAASMHDYEKGLLELEKKREQDGGFPPQVSADSASTYGTVNDDDFYHTVDEFESAPQKKPASDVSLENGKSYNSSSKLESKKSHPADASDERTYHASSNNHLEARLNSVLREDYNIRDIPQQNMFNDPASESNRDIPYFIQFMSHRLASERGFSLDRLWKVLERPSTFATAEEYWSEIAEISGLEADVHVAKREGRRLWQAAKTRFEGYTFKGQISFNTKRSESVFKLQLFPIQVDKSCRFQRKFGADRFLYLTAPVFDSKTLERFNKVDMVQIQKRWTEWLDVEHTFCGRKWRVFYTKPVKNKSKGRQQELTHDKRIVLFATSGCGIETISIGEMLNWFLPFSKNGHQTLCKIFSRISLGLSRTTPTVTFKPSQVKYTLDMRANGEEEATEFNDPLLTWTKVSTREVMNDGCSRISVTAAREIWRAYRASVGITDAQALPSAFQGRIGGAKGMWMVSGESFSKESEDTALWIEISESQLKFEPHDEDLDPEDNNFDPHRLTFEVLEYSKAPSASELHISFIPILADRGIPVHVITSLVTAHLDTDRVELLQALTDVVRTYEWLHKNGAKNSYGIDITWQAALPVSSEERIKLMLESGFSPTKNSFLAKILERFVQASQLLKQSKLRAPLGKSTFLFGIADPSGVLKPGSVHLQFSTRVTDKYSGHSYLNLRDDNILVARLPACRRSDIQKVRTSVYPELSHLIDVVVFPSRGQYPLAGKLQGGDYDGDVFWICWEPKLVEPFNNAPAPVVPPTPSDYGIETDKRHLTAVMEVDKLHTVDNFLHEAFEFTSGPSLTGMATALLDKRAYASNRIHSAELDQLCDLHDLLVDAPKQGYKFTDADFHKFKKERLGLVSEPKQPAYKAAIEDYLNATSGHQVNLLRCKDYRPKQNNVLDYLYFSVFRAHHTETSRMIKEIFANAFSETDSYVDETLLYPHKHQKDKNISVVQEELSTLHKQLEGLYHQWNSGFNRKDLSPAQKSIIVEECYEKYFKIQPMQTSHDHIKTWLEPCGGPDSYPWVMIKASALYARYPNPKAAEFVFKMAGRELMELKSRSFDKTRFVIAAVHANMKPKRIKAPAELDQEDEDGEEEEDGEQSANEAIRSL